MPTLRSLHESKTKKLFEDMENHINGDILAGMNDDSPLSDEQDKKKPDIIVPNGELLPYHQVPENLKKLFKQVLVYATNKDNYPEDYKPVGYGFSVVYTRNKPIDFNGGHRLNTAEAVGDEYFMSLQLQDEFGMNAFYKIAPLKSTAHEPTIKNM